MINNNKLMFEYKSILVIIKIKNDCAMLNFIKLYYV